MPLHSVLPVSDEKWAGCIMGVTLYESNCLSLAAFDIISVSPPPTFFFLECNVWNFWSSSFLALYILPDHNKLWKALKEMWISDHFTCLLWNLHAGQEATVRILYGTTNWFRIEKGIWQGCLLSPCLFNLYAEHIMWNARLDELQAGIKIGRRKINNLRYVMVPL